jgi:hypothetical protein
MSNSDENVFLEMIIPKWIYNFSKTTRQSDSSALDAFRNRISMQQAASGYDQPQRAPGFDYVRWKQHGQHRMHHNPEEYVRTCQGLAPFVSSVTATAWEGMDERRWAGMTTVRPEIEGLLPKSQVGSRSNFGSRDQIASVQ